MTNKNLISINDLGLEDINSIFENAIKYSTQNRNHFKQSNQSCFDAQLAGKTLVNFFFENSTRTRTSFEIAAKRLSCQVININVSLSSLKKGETISDTAKTINAMLPDFVVIRHNSSHMVNLLAKHIEGSVINAGDGTNEHPSQALLDCFTIKQNKGEIKNLTVTICGDVLHSRVARSNIILLNKLGAKIRIVTPPTLMPKDYQDFMQEKWGIKVYNQLEEGIEGADAIIMLRIQQERMQGCFIPSLSEYYQLYGLNHEKLKKANKNAIILHPGPLNRNVEISDDLADDLSRSQILNQVESGVAIRQAILKYLSG